MPENKDSGSKKGHSWFKPWILRKKPPGKLSTPQSMNNDKPSESPSQKEKVEMSDINHRDFKKPKSQWTKSRTPKTQSQEIRIETSDNSHLDSPKPLSQWKRPRALGSKQLANQPINVPIKEYIKIMRDEIIKIKNSTDESNKIHESEIKTNVPEEFDQECDQSLTEEPTDDTNVEELKNGVVTLEQDRTEEPAVIQEEITKGEFDDCQENETAQGINEAVSEPIDDTNVEDLKNGVVTSEQDGNLKADLFTEAVNLYRFGLAGDKEAVAQAYELLKKVHQEDPENRLAEAYFGSATSLLGRDVTDSNERFKFTIQGLKILDKVVSLEPENTEIRGLRAFLCSKLPEQYFHRSDTAIEDFAYLVALHKENNNLFPKEFFCQILFELGLAFNRLGKKKEAKSTCLKLLSLTEDPKYEALIKQEGILGSDQPRWQKQVERGFAAAKSDWAKAKDDEKLQEAISLHRRALSDDKLAVEKAFEIFKQGHKRNPQDPLIRAYYADCLSLMAQNSADTSVMFRHATHAIKNLDQAVNASPDNVTIRLLRGYNSYRIPEAFFKRTLTSIRDFEYLVEKYEQDPSIFPQETYWQLLYDLGHSYQRLDMDEEAKMAWSKLSQSGDLKYKTLVDEMINGGSDLDFSELGANSSVDELLKEGIRLYDLAVAGNTKAGLKAREILQRACIADPLSTIAEGYYGSSLAVTGRNATDPRELFRGFFRGLDHLKKAVARDPKDYRLHLLLANLFHNFSPSFFPASDKAVKEFIFLKMAYERDNSIFPEEVYCQVLYDLGVCYQRSGESKKAQKLWQQLSKITEDPKFMEISDVEEEGDTDMTKEMDKVREKYKEIAEELAQERAKERLGRRDKKRSRDKGKEGSKEETKDQDPDQGKSSRKERKRDRKRAIERAKEMPVEKNRRRNKKRTTDDQPKGEPSRKERKKDREKALERVKEMPVGKSRRRDKERTTDDQPKGKSSRKERKKDREKAIERVKEMATRRSGSRDKEKTKKMAIEKVIEKVIEKANKD